MGCVYNIIICTVYTYLSKHKYNIKTCCIKIVPTDCFACEAHQGTQQLKKQYYIYVERNKITKN